MYLMVMLLILFFQWYLDDEKRVKIKKRNYLVESILLMTASETLYIKKDPNDLTIA